MNIPSTRLRFSKQEWLKRSLATSLSENDGADVRVVEESQTPCVQRGDGLRIIILGAGAAGNCGV